MQAEPKVGLEHIPIHAAIKTELYNVGRGKGSPQKIVAEELFPKGQDIKTKDQALIHCNLQEGKQPLPT